MNQDRVKELIQVVPTERQVALQELEFYAFFHYTVNTYTGKEWGDGTESPSIFNPTKLDVKQWVKSIQDAGMKAAILTCKHHDGFCLWPSKYTEHSVKNSPYKNGEGDIVRELSDACREAGLQFGVYVSPWDRNHASYGHGTAYDDYITSQLTELLTEYGDICSVWFDGACGEGSNGKVQKYDWERYYALIRKLQPNACIHICGPDIRWCGNEAGHTRDSEWSVVSKRMMDLERIASSSQQSDDEEFRERKITSSDQDLGSREALALEKELVWFPAEVDTSIRPGWFYHEEEDDKVKSPEELFELYCKTVGGNCTLLLNIPPTKEGLIHENDVKHLKQLGEKIKASLTDNKLNASHLKAESGDVTSLLEDSYESFYMPESGTEAKVTMKFDQKLPVQYLEIKENILKSQRVEKFRITVNGGEFVYEATIIGYKKIVDLGQVYEVKQLDLEIIECREQACLSYLAVYEAK